MVNGGSRRLSLSGAPRRPWSPDDGPVGNGHAAAFFPAITLIGAPAARAEEHGVACDATGVAPSATVLRRPLRYLKTRAEIRPMGKVISAPWKIQPMSAPSESL